MRDFTLETEKRIEFIRGALTEARAQGIVFGNSGGKDAALTGILCKLACDDTVGIIMPCGQTSSLDKDIRDAYAVAEKFGIETRIISLTAVSEEINSALGEATELNDAAKNNIKPRLRMTTLYAIAASEARLVAGTGNRSERYMGYFTKWGDGAFDFNPVADLTVTEIFEFLEYFDAPRSIIDKAPSAGLFEGQTDEGEMGVTYKSIDRFLMTGECNEDDLKIINRFHSVSGHKLKLPKTYGES